MAPLPRERTSAQWIFRRHDAQALLKNSTLPAAESLAARCPFGRHPVLGGPWVPAFAGKTGGAASRGPGDAVVPVSLYETQRSERSAGAMCGFTPHSFPPRKRGPRNRDGAAATERTSAQWVFCWNDAQALLKNSTLPAAESLAARCPFGRHPMLGGPWVPAFAGKTRGGEESGGPGAAMAPLPRSGPQRSGLSAGTVIRLS